MAIRKDWIFRRGDLYMIGNPFIESGQGEVKPVVVLQNNDGTFDVSTLIVAPLTIRRKKEKKPTDYLVEQTKGFDHPFAVELDQVNAIDKRRVKRYIGKVNRDVMEGIDEALGKKLGLYIPISAEAP